MNIILHRKYIKDKYTIGELWVDNKFFCSTLEDPVRDINKNGIFDNGEYKIPNDTAIPYGEYEVQITYSPKFKRELPILLNVPHFEGIRIHGGNTNEDTSGCILLGENTQKGKVLNSRKYVQLLIDKIKSTKEKVYIKIV